MDDDIFQSDTDAEAKDEILRKTTFIFILFNFFQFIVKLVLFLQFNLTQHKIPPRRMYIAINYPMRI